jgi:hypothetical protein
MEIALRVKKGFLSILKDCGRAALGLIVIVVHHFALGLAEVTKTIGIWLNFSFANEALIYRNNGRTSSFGQAVSLAFFGLIIFGVCWCFL